MTDWKPIRTAPKDRRFLGFIQDHLSARIEICAWMASSKSFVPDSYAYTPHLWLAETKTGDVKITHWLPLPTHHDGL